MQKHSTIPYILAGASIGTLALLSTKPVRNRLMTTYNHVKSFIYPKPTSQNEILSKVGQPDPYDFGDNNMVSEGAMYSVQYYNENKQQ